MDADRSSEARRENSSNDSDEVLGFHQGDPRHVMKQYRRHILSCKKKWGTARGLIHYRRIVDTYLWAKRATSTVSASDP